MKTIREYIEEADQSNNAIGHFNVSDSEQIQAIFSAARTVQVPVIIGVSEGERDFIGVRQVAAYVKSLREEYDHPIFINADHSYSFERVKEAIDAGFDSAIYDGVKVSPEENVAVAKRCVEYAREVTAKTGRDILIEAELGNIGQSSKILDEIPKGADLSEDDLTKPDVLRDFIEHTGVDLIAPAVGNLHGMLRSGKEPRLHIDRIKDLRKAGGIPMVLHGGSGTSDEDFSAAIAAGIRIVHINTEIRLAYRKGIETSLAEDADQVAPYKFMQGGVKAVTAIVENRLRLFSQKT